MKKLMLIIALMVNGSAAQFKVVDRGLGRVALQWGEKFISVAPPGGKGQVTLRAARPSDAETFQWVETPYGDLILLSLATHRHLRVEPGSGVVSANHHGPRSDRKDGSCFTWKQK